MNDFIKLAGPAASLIASGAMALTIWGLRTGRWAQKVEDDDRASSAAITLLRTDYRDLRSALEEEHRVRRGVDTTIAENVSDVATRVTRLEERTDESKRDRDNIWSVINRRH